MIQAEPEQKRVVATLVNAIGGAKDGRHFVNGRAGSGKPTIAFYIYHHSNDGELQIINCATTGIAGLNLPECATAHVTYGIPILDDERSRSDVAAVCLGCRPASS